MRTKFPKKKEEEYLPKGITCACGEFSAFTGYVYAHWRDVLQLTCPICGRKYETCAGMATCIHTPMTVAKEKK